MITSSHLAQIFPSTSKAKRDRFLPALNKFLPRYGINTAKRVRAYLATGGLETDYLKTTVEYHDGSNYEGRRDLGNVLRGDGERYPGTGFFQTTGRYNFWRVVCRFVKKLTGKDFTSDEHKYRNFSEYLKSNDYDRLLKEADRLGVNFLANPKKMAEIDIAIESACIFWEENNISKYADDGKFFAVSGVVNRGNPNKQALHYEKRLELYRKACTVIRADFSFAQSASNPITTATEKPDAKCPNPNCNYSAAPPVCTKCGTVVPNSSTTKEPSSTDNGSDSTDKPVAGGVQSTSVKDFTNKYLKHTPQDTMKNIFFVVAARITAAATALWNFGFSGRALLFLICFAAIVPIVIAVVYYRPRLFDWGKQIFDGFFGE